MSQKKAKLFRQVKQAAREGAAHGLRYESLLIDMICRNRLINYIKGKPKRKFYE